MHMVPKECFRRMASIDTFRCFCMAYVFCKMAHMSPVEGAILLYFRFFAAHRVTTACNPLRKQEHDPIWCPMGLILYYCMHAYP
jgi:hypothetical protein